MPLDMDSKARQQGRLALVPKYRGSGAGRLPVPPGQLARIPDKRCLRDRPCHTPQTYLSTTIGYGYCSRGAPWGSTWRSVAHLLHSVLRHLGHGWLEDVPLGPWHFGRRLRFEGLVRHFLDGAVFELAARSLQEGLGDEGQLLALPDRHVGQAVGGLVAYGTLAGHQVR